MLGKMLAVTQPCKICGSETEQIGSKTGRFRAQDFFFRRCSVCRFTFVANPWTDYTAIYSADYYQGKGADPLVDYQFELLFPTATIRMYEWRGIVKAVGSLIQLDESTKWLDYGCGNGGLVRYCRAQGLAGTMGFEPGGIRDEARRLGIPFASADELDQRSGAFDVITSIEVFEHLEDPLSTLKVIRRLLKPGGLLFYTTGNAEPHQERLLEWQYAIPEIHIGLFEPESLRRALTQTGFRPEFRGYMPGFSDIIRFKILKNLRIRKRSAWQALLPWSVLSRMADARHHVTGHPIAWAI